MSGIRKTKASRGKIRMLGSARPNINTATPAPLYKRDLKGRSLDAYRAQAKAELKDELRSMTYPSVHLKSTKKYSDMDPTVKRNLLDLHRLAEDLDYDPESDSMVDFDRVLDGSERIELSHAGGELHDTLADEIEEEVQKRSDDEADEDSELYNLIVVDMFDAKNIAVALDPQAEGIAPALIMKGLIPCSPWKPTVAITVRVLEVYRVTHARCPQLAIQPFVKSLCDLHGASLQTEKKMLHSLGRDSFAWRLKHACPSCMYKLEGEEELTFGQLFCMDGNNSMKRVFLREKIVSDGDTGDGAEFVLGESKSVRIVGMPGKTCICRGRRSTSSQNTVLPNYFHPKQQSLSAKYPLAIVDCLLEHLGKNLGCGYDVGCDFATTLRNSPLGERAREANFQCLVGAFHGHTHNRLCQLCYLATYVLGLRLEDLEGCERFFSGSNGLASSCRYASRFHRQQEITAYVKHYDTFHTYANLSKFLCDNYNQALDILKKESALHSFMKEENIESYDVFERLLGEEKEYLLGLKDSSKTDVETLEMEAKYQVLSGAAKNARRDDAPYTPGVSKAEVVRRHGKEKMDKDLEIVQELEDRLEISDRWTIDSPQWAPTVLELKKRKYRQALDAMELLIVERIFELTKMNQSQTGYKMRQHIAKALQARSKAVRNVIDRYNAAAIVMEPPMAQLTWEQVVEYTFLADFDILRDTRAEVQAKPWTRPSYRLTMDTYFKIQRAREEIQRLNIEIRRLITWIRDEDHGKTPEQIESDLLLTVQLKLHRLTRGRFDDIHMQRFYKLAKVKGFTGNLRPGRAVENLGESGGGDEMDVDDVSDGVRSDTESEDEGVEAQDEEVSGLLYQVSMIAIDDRGNMDL
ncbi:hypothetical protein B0H14DRAFT_2588088 [Mycena olivaceomarginata]|nr:hypothetical protein B0H14DRAFT_2588088 [Mycena olivaceomarginata]